jgi:hypothetical protein
MTTPSIPVPNTKAIPYIIVGLFAICAVSYLLFLAASWNAYQTDRVDRASRIDKLLERFNAGVPEAEVTGDASGAE